MKKIISFALIGAAIAGVVYLLKNNDAVSDWASEAKEAGSDGVVPASDGYSDIRDRASTAISDIL